MPTGIYIRTEETRKKISDGCKRKGVGKWMKGRKSHHSEEHKKRLSSIMMENRHWSKRLGYKHSLGCGYIHS